MRTLNFTLKQHTPIIHFQYFLKDASARTTELKSALDKFIIGKKCNCWSSDKKDRLNAAKTHTELKKWFKHSEDPSNPSFDYDVEIFFKNTNVKIFNKSDIERFGFFGNMMNEESFNEKAKFKKGILINDLITLNIKSVYDDLLKEIDEIIAEFFLLKNFGTRQSKGFGSFYPIEKYDYLKTQKILPYHFDVNESLLIDENDNPIKYNSVFNIIALFYSTLRSGLNVKAGKPPYQTDVFYFKSLMWRYAKSKEEQWDKKSIKNKYLSKEQVTQDSNWKRDSVEYNSSPTDFPLGYIDKLPAEAERHLWRDLLGLSSDESWFSYRNTLNKKIAGSDSKINRFKSPIIFKPIKIGEKKYRVFFGIPPHLQESFNAGAIKNTETEILGKSFNVSFKNNSGLQLKYPATFNYSDFLKFAIKNYQSNWVENDYHDTNEFKIIDNIYNQLKPQSR